MIRCFKACLQKPICNLKTKIVDRQNNFDFLRLLFSSLVIFSHSFPLTKNPEILAVLTNNQLDFGILAVDVFFIMSGYLIFNSLKYSKSSLNYMWKRCLRLFPALFFMLLFSLSIACVAYAGNNIFRQKDFYTYLPNNLSLYKVQYTIKNVFETNPYPKVINGSLWSLCYEFTLYLFVLLFFPLRKNIKIVLYLLLISWAISFYAHLVSPTSLKTIFAIVYLESIELYRLATFFIAGSILSLVNLHKINTNLMKIILFVGLVLSLVFNVYAIFSNLLLPVLIILIGISFSKKLFFLPHKFGDISYGVYIYGFLVQQTLLNYFHLNPYWLAFISLSITYVFSYFSWHYIEKTTLKYKNYLL